MEQNPLKTAVQLALAGLTADQDEIEEPAADLLGLPETAARRDNLSNAGRGDRAARAITRHNIGLTTFGGDILHRWKY
jgi:hypothetical protein